MEVINGFIFIRADKPQEKLDSGLILSTENQKDPQTGEVVHGEHKGKRVLFKRYKFEDIDIDGEVLMVGKVEDIYALC